MNGVEVTNVIGAVSTIVANAPLGGQFITIGHSFGARILMASTLQNTIAAIQKAHPGRPNADYRTIDGLAQTTILLNPAFEAAYWTPIDAIRRHEERFSQDQKPVVLVIATDNDAATGYAFPLGQSVAWKTGANEITTLGNFPAFWTHDLSRTTEPVCQGTNNEKGLTEQYSAGEVCLRRTEGFAHNPFMLVRSHSDLLNGHNGIWDAGFTAWLFQYLDELGKQLPPKPRDN